MTEAGILRGFGEGLFTKKLPPDEHESGLREALKGFAEQEMIQAWQQQR